ncbi:MAG: amidohydrolase family protein, partial [Synergistaceae bacterium]|nr:amidohydrolase family protein [Synergistaceae bacterium]
SLLQKSLAEGAIGLKLTGGHYPLTPEATADTIKAATDGRSYIAFHAGSAKNGSNIDGFMDAVEFADGRPFHMAHVNAYCRGMVMKDAKEELKLAIHTLKENRQIVSEFHPAPLNGTSGKCRDSQPESHVTRNCLRMGGYPETEEGLRQALKDGYARVSWENLDGENRYVQGIKAFEYWENMEGACTCCFPVNNRESAFLCASAINENGGFVIDALSSDGGGIPRNFMIRYGYQLVDWGLWTIEDYVCMTSVNPARMLGLESKGHLSPGADADITVFDPKERRALLTIVKGRIVCLDNVLLAEEGTIICTEKGYNFVKSTGLNAQIVDLEKSMLYAGRLEQRNNSKPEAKNPR